MRYLGPSKGRKTGPTEEEAQTDMQALGGFLGQAPRPMPAHLKQLVREAEETKKKHRGM